MAEYRIYFFDKGGHIFRALDLIQENDEEAIVSAQDQSFNYKLELWQHGRMVRKFERCGASIVQVERIPRPPAFGFTAEA